MKTKYGKKNNNANGNAFVNSAISNGCVTKCNINYYEHIKYII